MAAVTHMLEIREVLETWGRMPPRLWPAWLRWPDGDVRHFELGLCLALTTQPGFCDHTRLVVSDDGWLEGFRGLEIRWPLRGKDPRGTPQIIDWLEDCCTWIED